MMTGDELHDAIATLKWTKADAMKLLRIDNAATFEAWMQDDREIPRWVISQIAWELKQERN